MSAPLKSWLASSFERFVAVKRAGGADYTNQAHYLAAFDRYLANAGHSAPLRQDTLLAFVSTLARLSPRGRDNIVSVVWQALRFARSHGARMEPLPARPPKPPAYSRQREPRIVALDEMRAVLRQARTLSGRRKVDAHRSATYATLFGLLFVTGMRVHEAIGLNVGDVDLDAGLVTIWRGKFGKGRVLPLRSSTLSALHKFLDDPYRPVARATSQPLFVSSLRRRLSSFTVRETFRASCRRARLAEPLPRLHDLRHSFSVLSVVAWYRGGRDVNALLPALSTYLGHVSVQNTRAYLRQNGLLLEEACHRFCEKTQKLDEVLS